VNYSLLESTINEGFPTFIDGLVARMDVLIGLMRVGAFVFL